MFGAVFITRQYFPIKKAKNDFYCISQENESDNINIKLFQDKINISNTDYFDKTEFNFPIKNQLFNNIVLTQGRILKIIQQNQSYEIECENALYIKKIYNYNSSKIIPLKKLEELIILIQNLNKKINIDI